MIPGKEVPLPQKITGLIGNFPQHWVGGSSQFPKPFYPKKAPISPKQQTKFVHKITQFFLNEGYPKGGAVICEKCPNIPVILFAGIPELSAF